MKVAMIAVRMVQMPVYQVIHVVVMRHNRMSAIRAVCVCRIVTTALVIRGTGRGRRFIRAERVLGDRAPVLVMQMAIVQIVYVAVVFDCGVSTALSVGVRMVSVLCHGATPGVPSERCSRRVGARLEWNNRLGSKLNARATQRRGEARWPQGRGHGHRPGRRRCAFHRALTERALPPSARAAVVRPLALNRR